MPDKVRITIITKTVFCSMAGLERLLGAFEAVPNMTPTHWGADEGAHQVYDHAKMVSALGHDTGGVNIPVVVRRTSPYYEAYFSTSITGLQTVKVEFSSPSMSDTMNVFKLGDAIADVLEPELGFVHPMWRATERGQEYGASGVLNAKELQEYGLNPVCARTWYGHSIAAMMGSERLEYCGAIICHTPWGVQLDLTKHPFEADFETLRSQQIAVTHYLASSGLYGDYRLVDPVPGPNWQPIR